MNFATPSFRMTALLGALALVAGCAVVPPGFVPESSTPDITTNPGTLTPGAPSSDWRVQPKPAPTAPVTSPTPSPVRTPAPVATPAPITTPAPVATPAPVTTTDTAAMEDYIFQQVNLERAKVGARALVHDATLRSVARSRSQDMGTRNYFDHVTPDGQKVFDLLREIGYAYSTAGENIAVNTYPVSQSAQAAMSGWMASSGHKANILATKYGRIGVGAYRTSSGKTYFTQVFSN